MTPNEEAILKLAQSIYLARNNRYNDVDGQEQVDFIDQSIDWINQYKEELEDEADWNFVRVMNHPLGTIPAEGEVTFTLPATINRLVASPYRDLVLKQDGSIIATFRVVNATQIVDPTDHETHDRVTQVGRTVIFSRPFKAHEVGAEVTVDVVNYIPELSRTNIALINLIKPKTLVILGVAKNATLPDIVQGGISPNLAQKYAEELRKAKEKNDQTSEVYEAPREDFSFVSGVF